MVGPLISAEFGFICLVDRNYYAVYVCMYDVYVYVWGNNHTWLRAISMSTYEFVLWLNSICKTSSSPEIFKRNWKTRKIIKTLSDVKVLLVLEEVGSK